MGEGVDTAQSAELDQIFDDIIAEAPQPKNQARHVLLRRLADVVCLPESRINAFERAVTADLLVEMLRNRPCMTGCASPNASASWLKSPIR